MRNNNSMYVADIRLLLLLLVVISYPEYEILVFKVE